MLPLVIFGLIGGGFLLFGRKKKSAVPQFPGGVDPAEWAQMQVEMGLGALEQGDLATAVQIAQILDAYGLNEYAAPLHDAVREAMGIPA